MIVIQILTLLTTLAALLAGCATPLLILYFFLYRVRILKIDWRPILAKGIVCFAAWLALTFGTLSLLFFDMYADRFEPPAAAELLQRELYIIAVTLVYSLACSGLCYWMKARALRPRLAERAARL